MGYESFFQIAETSLRIQDASSWRGVTREFCMMREWFMENYKGETKEVFGEEEMMAVMQMMTYKVAQLVFKKEPMESYSGEFSSAYRIVTEYVRKWRVPETMQEFMLRFPRLFLSNEGAGVLETLTFAKERKLGQQLMGKLEYLNGYAGDRSTGCKLLKDRFVPNSFLFSILDANKQEWMNGGLVYHAAGDSGLNSSVRIGPDLNESWEIHT